MDLIYVNNSLTFSEGRVCICVLRVNRRPTMKLKVRFDLKKFVIAARKRISRTGVKVIILALVTVATGVCIAIYVPGSDAQRQAPARSAPTAPGKAANAKRFPNFDIRLTGRASIEEMIRGGSGENSFAPDDLEAKISNVVASQTSDLRRGIDDLKASSPNAEVTLSPLTGAVEITKNLGGLTGSDARQDGTATVREFLASNQKLFGLNSADINDLNFIGQSDSPSGLRMVRSEQIANGRPIFQSETRFILDTEGRIISSLGAMIPQANDSVVTADILSPEEALKRTMDVLNVPLEVAQVTAVSSEENGFRTEMQVADPNIRGPVTSKLVYFPAAPGVLIPAWSEIVFSKDADWYVLVDARNGRQLWRKNIRSDVSTHQSRFRVYVQADGLTPADSPSPLSPSTATVGSGFQPNGIAPTIVSMLTAQNITASPNGWIDDCPGGVCTASQTQTLGNNVLACVDRSNPADVCDTDLTGVLDGGGMPMGNTDTNARNRDFLGTAARDFQTNFLPPPQGGNPEAGQTATGNGNNGGNAFDQFRRGSVVQQFYSTNWYHDKLFALGFNPAAGNFQNNNFGGGGSGNDRVLLDVQDGSGTNNANFSTPPDGTSGRAQMYIFPGPTIDRDGGIDAEVLLHELTHGTSNRLIGNGAGLQWDVGGGMGEGWSDYYALSLLNNTNTDNPNGNYAAGAYATYKLGGLLDNYVYGIRRFPYSTNNAVNPLTWADTDQTTYNETGGIAVSPLGFGLNGALEVHNVGEIWANTLWEVRSRIIAANAGDVPTGNQKTLQIVTDGLKLTPINPTFTQARDAIISADCATNACANEQSIWSGFADRGLGYGAAEQTAVQFSLLSGHIGVVESNALPNLDINTVTVDDSIANNNGFIDPNEPVRLNINLKNPWRNVAMSSTGVSATLASSTPGVSILVGADTYPTISAASNANASSPLFLVRAPSAAACGSSMKFTLTITSSLGTVARDFSLRVGQPSGTLAPVTYTRSALALGIPDNRGNGIIDTLNVPDDYQIADVNVRVDSLTHTWDGDLTVGIHGPSGYGTDLISLTGWESGGTFLNNGSSGDNFTNTTIDDEAVNGLVQATIAQAPYTGSWKPAFSSPGWVDLIGANPDSIPELGRFDGTSSLGQWKMVASDYAAGDTGTLQGWSLIITPQNFACTPFIPTAAPVSISGRVVTSTGRSISGVIVTLTDSHGGSTSVRTNTFGFYSFSNVQSGEAYVLTATARLYHFAPRVVDLTDNLTGFDLTAEP